MAFEETEKNLIELVEKAMGFLRDTLIAEYKAQGHVLTGKLVDTIDYTITKQFMGYRADMYVQDYALPLETGVSPSRIPYTPGKRTGAGRSKFIEGLIDFFVKRGRSMTDAKSAAFATATVMKRDGMPTRGSYKYSNNGRRKGAISQVLKDFFGELQEMLSREGADIIQRGVIGMVQEINQEMKV
jgi:hypothetical protein